MKSSTVSLMYVAGVLGAAIEFEKNTDCPPFSGDVTIDLPNIFPEGADFSYANCKFYVRYVNNTVQFI